MQNLPQLRTPELKEEKPRMVKEWRKKWYPTKEQELLTYWWSSMIQHKLFLEAFIETPHTLYLLDQSFLLTCVHTRQHSVTVNHLPVDFARL